MKLDAAFFASLSELPKVGHEPLNSADFSKRVIDFLELFVPPERWRNASKVLTGLLVDVSKDTAELASQAWRDGIEEAREEAGR